MKVLLTIVGVLSYSIIFAQNESLGVTPDPTKQDSTFIICELPGKIEPQFPGGHSALLTFIEEEIILKNKTVSGTVFIQFTVLTSGKLKKIKILKGQENTCLECNKTAVDIIKKMPNWIPGIDDGRIIKAKVIIPINFQKEG
jgi:TonB family protein